jgi:hypothetical protein
LDLPILPDERLASEQGFAELMAQKSTSTGDDHAHENSR